MSIIIFVDFYSLLKSLDSLIKQPQINYTLFFKNAEYYY